MTGILDGVMRYGIAGLRHDRTWGVAMQNVGLLAAPGVRSVATPTTPPSKSVRVLSMVAHVA